MLNYFKVIGIYKLEKGGRYKNGRTVGWNTGIGVERRE